MHLLYPELKTTINLKDYCYKTDNYFAYIVDSRREDFKQHIKVFNFVPTYDRWCLFCGDKDWKKKRCSKCKSVYFCNSTCQRKAWRIHKVHCGRDLFVLCASCGQYATNDVLKCDTCPVKFCNEKCKKDIFGDHKEFDCTYFTKMWG